MTHCELPLEVQVDQQLMNAGIEFLTPSRMERLPNHPVGSPEAVVVRLSDAGARNLIRWLDDTAVVVVDRPT